MRPPSIRPDLAVPFLDLRPSHDPLKAELLEAIAGLIDTNAYSNGPDVALFEEEFAAYCGIGIAVGVANGLDALRFALLALGVEPGDEVVVPALTFVATIEAVEQAGATPVLADISADDLCLDPEAAAAAITERTRYLMPVHLYGQLADMARLTELADPRGVQIIEDAAQAHGAERNGFRAGTAGIAGCFSFYPGKNLGAMGDAGALVTNDPTLAERVRSLREHGQTAKYRHDYIGYTSRLDTIQALVLRRKLPLLDGWNDERRRAAAYYLEHLAGVGDLVLPPVPEGSEPVWHLFTVQTADPAGLGALLAERGVSTGRHYPDPVHLSPAYRRLGYGQGAFPVAEQVASRTLSLPIFPGIREEQLDQVVHAVREAFDGG